LRQRAERSYDIAVYVSTVLDRNTAAFDNFAKTAEDKNSQGCNEY